MRINYTSLKITNNWCFIINVSHTKTCHVARKFGSRVVFLVQGINCSSLNYIQKSTKSFSATLILITTRPLQSSVSNSITQCSLTWNGLNSDAKWSIYRQILLSCIQSSAKTSIAVESEASFQIVNKIKCTVSSCILDSFFPSKL